MDLSENSFDWTLARAFLATAEEGSFSGAARRLRLTQPTLGRQVAALEQALGVVLFERTGRSMSLTEAGHDMLEHVQAMSDAADHMALIAAGRSQSIEGRVTITASDVMCTYVLPPVLRQLRQRAPRLQIDVVAANDIRDLMRREADIAIRHVRPDQPELTARQLREKSAHFYAARSYLQARGRPRNLDSLAQHDFLHFGDVDRMLEHLNPMGLSLNAEHFQIGSQNGVVCWELARQGLGIVPMTDEVGDLFPDMEQVLPDMQPFKIPVWVVSHRELHSSRRIRLVFDMLADFLQVR